MSRRIVSYILFCAVAVYATGLPQFVHNLVEHQGYALWTFTGSAASHGPCCSHTCPTGPISAQHDAHSADACDEENEGGCDGSHDCDVCAMLATSFAAAVAPVKVVQLHGLLPQNPSIAHAVVHLAERTEPHAPRGPPNRI